MPLNGDFRPNIPSKSAEERWRTCLFPSIGGPIGGLSPYCHIMKKEGAARAAPSRKPFCYMNYARGFGFALVGIFQIVPLPNSVMYI